MGSNLTVSHPYLRAVTQDAFRQEALDGVKKGANSLPAYDYSGSGLKRPSYAVFSRYNSQPKSTLALISTKLSHIPGALFSTVKIPLHLGKAFVIDPLTAPCTQKRSFKPDLYRAGRDVQEVKGHLLGLFVSEKWGAYHLAESDFYKQCYSIMEQPYDTKLAIPKYEIKPKITDQTVADTPLSEIPKFVKGLNCEQLFHLSFTHEQLKAIPLSELTPHQLNGLFPPFQLDKRNQQLNSLDKHINVLSEANHKRTMKKRKKAIERLQAFTPFEINAVKDRLQPEVYALHKIVDARKTLLTTPVEVKHFELFTPEVIIEALFTDASKEEIEKRINELELPVLQKLLPHLSTELLLCIKNERLGELDLSTLTEKQKAVFTDDDDSPSTSAVTAMRKKLFGDGKNPLIPTKPTTPVKKDETITFTYFGKTLLIGKKVYDFAIDFIKTVWKGVRVVFAYATFPIWKPYQLLQSKSISKETPDIPPPPL